MITQQLQHDESLPCRLLRRNARSKHFNTGRDRWNQMESAPVLCPSVYSGNFIPVSILCPLFTLLSLHLIFSPHLPPLPWCTFYCLSFPPVFWFPLSPIRPTQWGPAPVDPLIEISAQQSRAQKGKCYFEVISEGPCRAVGSSPASRAVSGIRLRTTQI